MSNRRDLGDSFFVADLHQREPQQIQALPQVGIACVLVILGEPDAPDAVDRTCLDDDAGYPDDTSYQVSHETIYRTLFIQARGALKKELLEHLRRTRAMRRSRHHTQKKENHGRITDAVSIRERPAAAKDRAVPGHWEGDLLCGSKNSQIATLVERHTRYVMRVKLDGKDSETVISALIENVRNSGSPRAFYIRH